MAKNSQTRSIEKTLRTLSAKLKATSGIKGRASASIKIDVDTGTIERILKQTEKFPFEARKAFKQALQIIANDLWATLDENMEANVWSWTDDTRDIIDTGALRDSGRVYVDGDDIVITYSEEYAALVHFGGYIKSGFNPEVQIVYPARPWVQATLTGDGPVPGFDFDGALRRNFFEVLAKGVFKDLL